VSNHYSGRSGGSGGGHGGTYPASTYGRSETVTAVIPDTQTATSIGLMQLGNAGAPCALEPYGGTGGGGGAGAGAPAGCYIDSANGAVVVAGHGGDGYSNNILGTEYFWAGGGGGGSFGYQTNIYSAGNGGRGGGGGGGAFGEQVTPQPRQGSAGAKWTQSLQAPGVAGAGWSTVALTPVVAVVLAAHPWCWWPRRKRWLRNRCSQVCIHIFVSSFLRPNSWS
jgi:hypothetical protein